MNKRIRLVTLCLAMLVVLIFSTTTAFAASTVIRIDADKTEVQPGETITINVVLGPVADMGTMQMIIVIPEGLTYTGGSGKLADGLKNTLGFDYADFTEASMMVNGVASKADYSSDGDTLLCTIQCVADEDFSGTVEVGLRKLEFYSCQNWKDHTSEYSVSKAVIKIGKDDTPADPGPSGSEEPSGQPHSGGNTDPEPTGDGGSEEQIQPGGNTDPEPTGNGGSGEQTQPGGNNGPEPSGDGGSGEQAQPGGNNDPEPTGDGGSGEQTQPSGNTDPDSSESNEETPTNMQPDSKRPEDESKKGSDSSNKSPDGGDTPSGNDGEGPSGEEDNGMSDQSSEGNNIPDKEKAPETDNNSHRDNDRSSQRALWVTAISAAIVIVATLIILFIRKKRK